MGTRSLFNFRAAAEKYARDAAASDRPCFDQTSWPRDGSVKTSPRRQSLLGSGDKGAGSPRTICARVAE